MLVQYVHEVDVKTILFGKYKIEQIRIWFLILQGIREEFRSEKLFFSRLPSQYQKVTEHLKICGGSYKLAK